MQANPERGEVPVTLGAVNGRGGVEIVIALEMEGLARLSGTLGTKTIAELYQRLVGFEPGCVLAAIDCLTVAGDKVAARKALKLTDIDAWSAAISAALSAHIGEDDEPGEDEDDPGGNAPRAGTKKSRSGAG